MDVFYELILLDIVFDGFEKGKTNLGGFSDICYYELFLCA